MNKKKPLASICCITYNQKQYIECAIKSFLAQKTNFDYEIIIHDDASTDGTAEILKKYEKKYPNKIKVLYEKENQYSRGNKRIMNLTFEKAKGKYVALCEGDDYWTDEKKLQYQVDYMENHEKCTFCFHNAEVINMETNSTKTFIPFNPKLKKYLKKNNEYNVGELELLEFIPTASYLIRANVLQKFPDWYYDCFVGDWPLKLLSTSFGYAYYIDKKMSIYRQNTSGSVTKNNLKKQKKSIKGLIELINKKRDFINNIDDFTKHQYSTVFNKRRTQYDMQELLAKKDFKKIICEKYLANFSFTEKLKYIIKMCIAIVK